MTILKSSFFLLSLTLMCCCSSKKSVADEKTGDATDISVDMMKNGFSSGTIVQSKDGSSCPFVIDIDDENYNYLLDPINLDEKYKQDGLKIWFKFNALRMQNRCEGANPVNVSEVQLKE